MVHVQPTPKMKPSCCDRSDLVQFVMKTKQDNDMIDNIGLVYIKTKIELSGHIWPGAVCDEN